MTTFEWSLIGSNTTAQTMIKYCLTPHRVIRCFLCCGILTLTMKLLRSNSETNVTHEGTSALMRRNRKMKPVTFLSDEKALKNMTRYSQQLHNFRSHYHPTFNKTLVGKKFVVDRKILERLWTYSENYIDVSVNGLEQFVFATAASSNHFLESLDTIGSVQRFKPRYKILYFDLGLLESQIKQLKKLCRVKYRKFHFDQYPAHVKDLRTYAWKPIIIQEVLQKYGAVLWMDSSARLISRNFTELFKVIKRTGGAALLSSTGHSNFAVTHPKMYEYLPTNVDRMKKLEQREAIVMLYNTKEIYEGITQWLLLCSLDQQCIAPIHWPICRFKHRFKDYAGCHRFDQSAINILMANHFNFDDKLYFLDKSILKIERYPTISFKLKYCRRVRRPSKRPR